MLTALAFRLAATAHAIVLLAQAFLAGVALSGSGPALGAHMFGGGTALLNSAVQCGAALAWRRSTRLPGWLIAASLALLVADTVQMAAGRLRLLALHLPLGLALFGASVSLSIYSWAWRPVRGAAPPRSRAGELVPEGPSIKATS